MSRPLTGRRVVVCRAPQQSGQLIAALERAGAVPVAFPLIEVVPPDDDGAALGAAVDGLSRYRWVLLTSANAVHAVRRALGGRKWPQEVAVATIGPATEAAARAAAIPVTIARDAGTGRDLAGELPPDGDGSAVLMPVAELAGPEAGQDLARAGWTVDRVTAYRTLTPAHPPELRRAAAGADAVLFTSPSTVDRFLDATDGAVPPVVVCIGPTTATRAERRGLALAGVADEQSDAGLLAALVRCWSAEATS